MAKIIDWAIINKWLLGGGLIALITVAWTLSSQITANATDIDNIKDQMPKKASIEMVVIIQKDIEDIKRCNEQQNKNWIDLFKLLAEKNK